MDINNLVTLVLRRRGHMGIRTAASEIGISPTTLTRIEKGNVPDVATLEKLCSWLGEEPTKFIETGRVQIAFKKQSAVPKKTAKTLASLIEKSYEQFSKQIESEVH